jgi:hypothetical protein
VAVASLVILSTSSLITASAASRTGWTVVRCQIRAGLQERNLTICGRSRVSSGQDGLSIATLSLKSLSDGSNLLSYSSILVDFGLQLLKDALINHRVSHLEFTAEDGWRC